MWKVNGGWWMVDAAGDIVQKRCCVFCVDQ